MIYPFVDQLTVQFAMEILGRDESSDRGLKFHVIGDDA